MGREIRRVPPHWEHPKDEEGQYMPMYDKDFDTRLAEWLEGYELWKKGEHPYQKESPDLADGLAYWEYDGAPPDPEYYRPKFDEEPTWYQIYQTVSEGTPVTPPFATKEELVDYLVKNGDFWDQKRGDGGWDRKNAEHFVQAEWAPSGIFIIQPDGKGEHKAPRDGA
jgi:hypothetical protein